MSRRHETEHRWRAWSVWHTIALGHYDPKKLPSLDKLTGLKKRVRAQSTEELAANIKRMFN